MPWEKSFDVSAVLDRAMQEFWRRGYEATSMQDLVNATGVNRASLYATYGDKQELFAAALRHYDKDVRSSTLSRLAETHAPDEAIANLFDMFIGQTGTDGGNWGCFIVNTSLELAAHEPKIAETVNKAHDEIEAFFRSMIEKGQGLGTLNKDLDVQSSARQMLAVLLGLLVMIRSRPAASYLRSIRDGALASLR